MRASRIHDLADTLRVVAAWRVRHGLTANQAEVLLHLYDSGALTSSELARLVGITTASMARLVARLEATGWIVRHPDERDGRRIVLQPSRQLAIAIEEVAAAVDEAQAVARSRRGA